MIEIGYLLHSLDYLMERKKVLKLVKMLAQMSVLELVPPLVPQLVHL